MQLKLTKLLGVVLHKVKSCRRALIKSTSGPVTLDKDNDLSLEESRDKHHTLRKVTRFQGPATGVFPTRSPASHNLFDCSSGVDAHSHDDLALGKFLNHPNCLPLLCGNPGCLVMSVGCAGLEYTNTT